MLVDRATIHIESGDGGLGSEAIFLERMTGGDGGNGGHVYLVGDDQIYDLGRYIHENSFKAERGKNGEKRNRTGRDGKDLILTVPLATEAYVNNKMICRIDANTQNKKILRGGIGALGNVSQRKIDFAEINPKKRLKQKLDIQLVLKLLADVVFIGYPNAGKSTMLNELTNSKVKVAPYAFTTLEPQFGLMDGIRLLDLPGLIEGTSEGKGLGTRFVKHTESSKMVAHFVSLENPEPLDVYKSLREEVKKISEELYAKKEVVILTKSDEADPTKIKKVLATFKKAGITPVFCSIIDDNSILAVKEAIISMFKQ